MSEQRWAHRSLRRRAARRLDWPSIWLLPVVVVAGLVATPPACVVLWLTADARYAIWCAECIVLATVAAMVAAYVRSAASKRMLAARGASPEATSGWALALACTALVEAVAIVLGRIGVAAFAMYGYELICLSALPPWRWRVRSVAVGSLRGLTLAGVALRSPWLVAVGAVGADGTAVLA